jgi:Glycosyltransferase
MIYINGKYLAQSITGVQRFAREITAELIKRNDNFTVIAPSGTKLCHPFCSNNTVLAGPANPLLWEQYFLPSFLKKVKNPLLINFTGLGPVFYKNKVITIHDLSFWEHPEWFSKQYYLFYRILTPISARNSRNIITVSETSKHKIIDKLKVVAGQVAVVYNAANKRNPTGLSKTKSIIAVGSMDPRKNLNRLIKSFIKWNNSDYELFLIGGKQDSFQQDKEFPFSNQIKFLGYIPDKELFEYYERAEFFIYPTLYEGFGIPPLEAMSVGTPVIASDIPSLRESCGDSALLVDPYSEESIIHAIDALSKDETMRRKLVQKGYDNLQRFSWELSADKIVHLIKELES